MKRIQVYSLLCLCIIMQASDAMHNWSKNLWNKFNNYTHGFCLRQPVTSKMFSSSKFSSSQYNLTKYRTHLLFGTGLATGVVYLNQNPLKAALFNIVPPLTPNNIRDYPRYKDAFIQKAVDSITEIDADALLALLYLYPESAERLVRPVAAHFDTVPSSVILSIMRKYEPAAFLFIIPVMNNFTKTDPAVIDTILWRNWDSAPYFIAPAAMHFNTTAPEVLLRILFLRPEAASVAFTEPALKYWESSSPEILRAIVNGNPKAPAFLKERLKVLENSENNSGNNDYFIRDDSGAFDNEGNRMNVKLLMMCAIMYNSAPVSLYGSQVQTSGTHKELTSHNKALLREVLRGNPRTVQGVLLAADVNAKDEFGFTVLMYAVSAERSNPDVVKVLINAPANLNIVDDYGWSELMHAASRGKKDILMMLLKANANPFIVSTDAQTMRDFLMKENIQEDAIEKYVKDLADKTFESILKEKHPKLLEDSDIQNALASYEKRRLAHAKKASVIIGEGIRKEDGRHMPTELTDIMSVYYADETSAE